MKKLNIILIGTQKIAYYSFKKIIKKKKYNILFIITKKKNKNIENLSIKNKIKIFKIKNKKQIKKIFNKNKIKNKIDLIILICFGLKIPKNILKKPKLGCYNIHPSLLPKLKGPSPIQYSILNNYKITGVTIIKMNKEIDMGPIVIQKKYKIKKKQTYKNLYNKLTKLSSKLLNIFIKKIIKKKKIKYKKQNKNKSTYSKKIYKYNGKVNWNNTAKYIERQIRAFYIWPKTFFYYKKYIIFIWKVKIIKNKNNKYKIGEIINYNKKYLDIKTNKNILRITKIQINNKKKNNIKDIFNSKPKLFNIGYILK